MVVTIITPIITIATERYPTVEIFSRNNKIARNTEKIISPLSNNAESEALESSNPIKNNIGPITAPDNAIDTNSHLSLKEIEEDFFEIKGVATNDAKK